jgi:FkbM family methyltransferase
MEYFGKIRRMLKEIIDLWPMSDFRTWFENIFFIIVGLPSIIKNGDLQEERKRMFGRKYKFKVFGKEIILDGKYFGRATELYVRGVYFSLPEFKLKPNMVVFDLGANLGIFTVLAALCSKKVVAVEAVKKFIPEIEENLRSNDCSDKVSVVLGVIGEGTGMFADPQIRKKWFGDNPPPVFSFDELMRKENVDKVDFIKIDIEGSEFDLFKKKENWFSRVNCIAMEIHNSFLSSGIRVPGGDMQKVINNLRQSNFDVKLLDLDGKTVDEIKGDAGYLFAKNLSF